jgi:UDP-N-acetylglucosamine 2-epimerase (non-hydrolysing)
MVKIAVILGTRPEIIKMCPIIRACEEKNIDYFILHTGQHYSYLMDQAFFDELELPKAKYNLDAGSGTHAVQTANILTGIETVLLNEKPDIVLVQGDTNTVLAGALAAVKLHIKVGHVEAGLRSFDRSMPEEINRIIADHISDFLYAPTETSRQNLLKEGIPDEKIFVTGNTVADAAYQNLEISKKHFNILSDFGIGTKAYFLATMHRAENVDVKERLSSVLEALQSISGRYGMPVIFPMHPRTVKMVKQFGLSLAGITVVQPLGYLEFLQLEENARVILTDSGGLQEEGCILGTPCITLRDNTERPETVDVGANVLAGTDIGSIIRLTERTMTDCKTWTSPFGDGDAGGKIMRQIIYG